jgi:hypothetical protein
MLDLCEPLERCCNLINVARSFGRSGQCIDRIFSCLFGCLYVVDGCKTRLPGFIMLFARPSTEAGMCSTCARPSSGVVSNQGCPVHWHMRTVNRSPFFVFVWLLCFGVLFMCSCHLVGYSPLGTEPITVVYGTQVVNLLLACHCTLKCFSRSFEQYYTL